MNTLCDMYQNDQLNFDIYLGIQHYVQLPIKVSRYSQSFLWLVFNEYINIKMSSIFYVSQPTLIILCVVPDQDKQLFTKILMIVFYEYLVI